MELFTKEQQESYENGEICYICNEKLENIYLKDKKYRKIRDLCHYTLQRNIEVWHIAYVI